MPQIAVAITGGDLRRDGFMQPRSGNLSVSHKRVGGLTRRAAFGNPKLVAPLSQLNLPIPAELIEQVADAIAQRAFELFAARMASNTPWMTTDEAIAYTRIPPGTFEKLAARGIIPSHKPDDGRRKLYHREELDGFLGYARPHSSSYARGVVSADAA
jgi:excisionase family DNA binding protein